MAIAVAASNTSRETTGVTSHTISLPSGISSGNRLVVGFSVDNALTGITTPSGWTEVANDPNPFQSRLAIFERVADGGEGSTLSVTTDSARQSTHVSYRLSGATGSADASVSAVATGFDGSPQSGTVTPSGGSQQYAFLSIFGVDRNRTVFSYPANMTTGPELGVEAFDTGGASIGADVHIATASSFSPDPFTINSSEGWVAFTVAVPAETAPSAVASLTAPAVEIAAVGTDDVAPSSTGDITAPSFAIAASGTGAAGSVFYVSSSLGNDANPGTQALPWRTLGKVMAQTFSPNDQILFRRGDVFRRANTQFTFAPPSSGTAGNPIIFGAYGTGNKPSFRASVDGTDGGNWTNLGGNLWESPALYYGTANNTGKWNTPAWNAATGLTWDAPGNLPFTGLELGIDRTQSNVSGDWQNQGSNVWKYSTAYSDVGFFNPDTMILDASFHSGADKKTSTGNITAQGHWGLIGNEFYIYSASDPDTNYQSIVFAELNTNGHCATYHDGVDRYTVIYDNSGSGPNATHSTYLEVVDNQYALLDNGIDYITFQNLDFRHGLECIFTSNSIGWTFTDCDWRQSCRNGWNYQNTGTNEASMSGCTATACGSYYQKQTNSTEQNGHGLHVAGTADITITDFSGGACQEDLIQTSNGFNATVTMTGFSCSPSNREDVFDQKGGTVVVDMDGGTILNGGDGVGRQCFLHHNNALSLTVENGTWASESAAAGDFFSCTRGGQNITFRRIKFINNFNTNKQILQITDTSDVLIEGCTFFHNSNNSMIRVTANFTVTSRHNSYYRASGTGGTAMIANESPGNPVWQAENDIYVAEDIRILDWSGSASSGTSFENCLFWRVDQVTDWIENGASNLDEVDIDGGLTDGNLVIDADAKTENPDWTDRSTGDFTIASGAGAASGGKTGTGFTTDINGNAYDSADPEIGAYAVSPDAGDSTGTGALTAPSFALAASASQNEPTAALTAPAFELSGTSAQNGAELIAPAFVIAATASHFAGSATEPLTDERVLQVVEDRSIVVEFENRVIVVEDE